MTRSAKITALILVAGIAVVLVTWKAVRLERAARLAASDVDRVLALAGTAQEVGLLVLDPGQVAATLNAAARSVAGLRNELSALNPVLAMVRSLPGEPWIADVPDALAAAEPVLGAGATVAAALARASVSDAETPAYLGALDVLEPSSREIADRLRAAERHLGRLRDRNLRGSLARAAPYVEPAAEALPWAISAFEALPSVRSLLGFDQPRTYLLLGQNNTEIRATGGFIGSAGTVRVENGRVTALDYGSSYDIDAGVTSTPSPPAPLTRYLGLGGWYFRDANWWPDFPTTAAEAEAAWLRAGHPSIDGVIAFDTEAVKALLALVGPIEVEPLGLVDGANFDQQIAQALYGSRGITAAGGFHQAKAATLAPVGRALLQNLLSYAAAPWALANTVLSLAAEKHFTVVVKDSRVLRLLQVRGWTGALAPVRGDSLYVVDTTVSYGDAYPFIRSNITLRIGFDGAGRLSHELLLTYANVYPEGIPSWLPPAMVGGTAFDARTGRFYDQPGFWGNWLRVYVPPAATGVQVEGLLDPTGPYTEFDRRAVAGYLPLEPGATRAIRVSYVLEGLEPGESLALWLQKQPGTTCRPTEISVDFPDAGEVRYQGCPRVDQWVRLTEPSGGGRPG